MSRWKDRKEQQLRRERDKKEQAKMDDCTFHPKINKTSRRTASLGRRDYKDVVERLYTSKKKSRVNEEDIRAKREGEVPPHVHFPAECREKNRVNNTVVEVLNPFCRGVKPRVDDRVPVSQTLSPLVWKSVRSNHE